MLPAFLLALPLLFAAQSPADETPPPPAEKAVDTGAEFTAALDGVYTKLNKRDWKGARKELLAVLARFENSEDARGKLLEIEEIAQVSAFWSTHPDPDPKSLISGEVGLLDRNSDLVRISYEKGRTVERNAKRAKFRPISVPVFDTGSDKKTPAPFPDFEQMGLLTLHPMQFNGPYTAEVRGSISIDGGAAPSIVLILDTEEILAVQFGDLVVISRITDDGRTSTTEPGAKPSGVAAGEDFKLEVSVSDSSVTFRSKGRIVVQSPKPKGKFGWFGFIGNSRISAVKLSGKTYGQWFDALVDAAVAEDRAKFDAQNKPRNVLPAWLYDVPDKAVRNAEAEEGAIKRVQSGFALDVGRQWRDLTQAGKWEEALATVDIPDDPKVKPMTRAWAMASALLQLDRLEEARAAASIVTKTESGHYEMRLLEAAIGARIDRSDAAVETARKFVRDFPASLEARQVLISMLIRRGMLVEAQREAERGFAAGVDRAEMEKLVKQSRRAVTGPTWRTTNRYESDHYTVASDMDRATCVQLAKALEETYGFLARAIGPLPAGRPSMRVFVFSGKQAYSDYCEDLVGKSMNRTQGMFTPQLAQLLFWNAVDRDEFVQTARHEAVHQYVDALVPEMPVWLHEGLAQYFETMRKEKGQFVAGAPPTAPRQFLQGIKKGTPWLRLDVLFNMRAEQFYGTNANLWYALSWAVVHALADGAPEDRKLFDALIERIARGVDGKVAVRETFEGVDKQALLERIRLHAEGL